MVHKIGYIQRKSGTLTPARQEQELLDYGVKKANIHDTLEGITRPGEFQKPDDVLIVWDLSVIGKRDLDAVCVNIAYGGSKGIHSIFDKKTYRVKNPATKDRADMMAALNGAEYKDRSRAAKGKAGRSPILEPDQIDRAKALAAQEVHIDDIAFKTKNRKTGKPVSSSTIRRALK